MAGLDDYHVIKADLSVDYPRLMQQKTKYRQLLESALLGATPGAGQAPICWFTFGTEQQIYDQLKADRRFLIRFPRVIRDLVHRVQTVRRDPHYETAFAEGPGLARVQATFNQLMGPASPFVRAQLPSEQREGGPVGFNYHLAVVQRFTRNYVHQDFRTVTEWYWVTRLFLSLYWSAPLWPDYTVLHATILEKVYCRLFTVLLAFEFQ